MSKFVVVTVEQRMEHAWLQILQRIDVGQAKRITTAA